MVKYVYDAWGNHTVSGSNTTLGNLNPFRYRSYFFDTETKLYYLKTRYYDPAIGRFINMDSIQYADPETIGGLNLYAYCNNNPVMGYDPEGTWSLNKFFKALAWVALGASAVACVVFTGVAAVVALGATAGGLVGGYMNEAAGGSFEAGWIGGAINGAIQSICTIQFGYIGTVLGGGVGSGIGTFITQSLNCLQQHKKFDLQDIAQKSISAGLSSAFTSIFTAGVQFLGNSGINEAVGSLGGSTYTTAMNNIFTAIFGTFDDYLSYKLSKYF